MEPSSSLTIRTVANIEAKISYRMTTKKKMYFKMLVLYVVLFLCSNAIGGPHSHKSSPFNLESFEDNSHSRDNKHFKNGEHNYEFDHESILGSHNAAEEFDQLSPEESKKRLKLLALKMDKTHDGYVDQKELSDWVLKSFRMLTEEEAMDQLEDEDNDNNGKVTWEEHAAETYGIYDDDILDEQEKKSSEEYKMLQNDKEIFDAADKNKDGILEKSEFPSFSHPEEFEHMHEIIYQQAMNKRDKDGNGYLSFEEFIADHNGDQPNANTEHYILEKDRFVNDLDLNKDGKLNREEVLQWLIPNNNEMAQTEADHLVESSDDDKDGKLSIDEIVNHYEIFVGSEATDFGEHLHNTHKFSDEL